MSEFYVICIYNPTMHRFIYCCEDSVLKFTSDEDNATKFNFADAWLMALKIYRKNEKLRNYINIIKFTIENDIIICDDSYLVQNHVLKNVWDDVVGKAKPLFYI